MIQEVFGKFKTGVITMIMTALFLGMPALQAYADNGDGTSGGQGEPLTLVSSDPAQNQQGVLLSAEITLTFSKNVINMSVSENNQKCFSLHSADGKQIPIKVLMADDQMEPEKKRIIIISPTAQLSPDTQYTVKISPDLSSKSGVTLGQPVSITFATAKGSAAQDKSASPEKEKSLSPAASTTSAVKPEAKQDPEQDPVKASSSPNSANQAATRISAEDQKTVNEQANTTPTSTAENSVPAAGKSKGPALSPDSSTDQGPGSGILPLAGLLVVIIVLALSYWQKRK